MHELILGGQKSGKSRCAEQRAGAWLQQPGNSCVLLVTALGHDEEMRERIRRHRDDRSLRLPALRTDEVPRELPLAIASQSSPDRLLVVDCLTLWLTNLLMPMHGSALSAGAWASKHDELCEALVSAPGPVLMISNEISLGLTPMGREARHFVDELGLLHQTLASLCSRVTLMVAGLEMALKRGSV